MNEYKRDRKTKQESEFSAPQPVFSNASEIVAYCNKLPLSHLLVFNSLLFLSNRHEDLYPTQSTIAKRANISREQANRILSTLREKGFISSNYRHMTSCLYKIATIFEDLELREKLRHLFPAFKWLPLVLCYARGYTIKTANVTRYNISLASNIYITNPKGIKDDNRHPLARAVMQHAAENPIPPSIQKLKSLNLTKAGQIRLTCFPDEAIEYAAEKLRYAKNARDPYALFFSECKNYCQNNQLLPNWRRVKALMQQYNIAEDAPRVRTAAQPPVAQVAAKKQEPKKAEIVREPKYWKGHESSEADKRGREQYKIEKARFDAYLLEIRRKREEFERKKLDLIRGQVKNSVPTPVFFDSD